jgi:dTDP-4-amino-4,6-dideoxygalactose transaminase
VARRRAIAARYRERLRDVPCAMPPDAGPRHVYHRFVVEVERPPDLVQGALGARGVAARRPVYRPAHRALGLAGFPEADRLWSRALSLPCYPTLTDPEVDTVAAALAEALR